MDDRGRKADVHRTSSKVVSGFEAPCGNTSLLCGSRVQVPSVEQSIVAQGKSGRFRCSHNSSSKYPVRARPEKEQLGNGFRVTVKSTRVAGVVEWYHAALPRRNSRVQIPSLAQSLRGAARDFFAWTAHVAGSIPASATGANFRVVQPKGPRPATSPFGPLA